MNQDLAGGATVVITTTTIIIILLIVIIIIVAGAVVNVRVWAVALCAAAAFVCRALRGRHCSVARIRCPPSSRFRIFRRAEALCGGAAAAMVMRYWGARDVYPDAFAPLVDRAAGGIRTSALVGALEQRGWTAAAGPATRDADVARARLRGRPVIALIEDRPGRFHYVVVVSSAGGEDRPARSRARAVARRRSSSKFDAAWQKSQRWMLILLPPGSGVARSGDPSWHRSASARIET